jgi:hypothetical protein
MISASNETATGYLDLTNEPISVYKNGQRVSGISTLADLASIQIEPGTAIVFTRIALFSEISSGRFQYRASDFPASGYSLSVGVYVTDASITTVFEDSKYSENTQVTIENGADGFVNVTLGRTAWQDVTATLQYVTIVFKADTGTPAFTCDYSTGVELAKPPTADMVLEDQATGKRYTVEQAQGATVDQQYNAQSANAQSGVAVAQALQTIPTVTVDQTYNSSSTNAQSGVAVAQALLNAGFKKVSLTNASLTVYSLTTFALGANYHHGSMAFYNITADNLSDILPTGTNAIILFYGLGICDYRTHSSQNLRGVGYWQSTTNHQGGASFTFAPTEAYIMYL